jgi:hypothetical protein
VVFATDRRRRRCRGEEGLHAMLSKSKASKLDLLFTTMKRELDHVKPGTTTKVPFLKTLQCYITKCNVL